MSRSTYHHPKITFCSPFEAISSAVLRTSVNALGRRAALHAMLQVLRSPTPDGPMRLVTMCPE